VAELGQPCVHLAQAEGSPKSGSSPKPTSWCGSSGRPEATACFHAHILHSPSGGGLLFAPRYPKPRILTRIPFGTAVASLLAFTILSTSSAGCLLRKKLLPRHKIDLNARVNLNAQKEKKINESKILDSNRLLICEHMDYSSTPQCLCPLPQHRAQLSPRSCPRPGPTGSSGSSNSSSAATLLPHAHFLPPPAVD